MKILWTSDQHTLHRTTPTHHILTNLNTFLLKENDLSTVDIVAFGGDFMDRLVEANNPELKQVLLWAKNFKQQYHKLNPKGIVIWLEGTSSHDWGQPEHFLAVRPKGLDVRYRDTVSIDIFPELNNLSILYVPDNLGAKSIDEIWEMCLETLTNNNLSKVDLVFLHGAFNFQLHPKVQHKGHLLERFETMVTYGILAGHVHKPIQQGKLYTSGSFDRTARGEMHPKGGLIVTLDKDKDLFEVEFWENKKALPYLDIKINKETLPEELIKKFHDFIKDNNPPYNSQIAIVGGSSNVVSPIISVLQSEFPQYGIKSADTANKDKVIAETVVFEGKYQGVTINKNNLLSSVMPLVEDSLPAKGLVPKDLENVLEELL